MPTINTIYPITQELISQTFSSTTLLRAKPYVNKISHVEFSPEHVSYQAHVQGTARHPYDVELMIIEPGDGEISLDSVCTCPVAYACKHGAALALFVSQFGQMVLPSKTEIADVQIAQIIEERQRQATLRWVEAWVEQLATMKEKATKKAKQTASKNSAANLKVYYLLYLEEDNDEFPAIKTYKGKALTDTVTKQVTYTMQPWNDSESALRKPGEFVGNEDLAILNLLKQIEKKHPFALNPQAFWLHNDALRLLDALVATGRCAFSRDLNTVETMWQPLQRGETRQCALSWEVQVDGLLLSRLIAEPAATLVMPTKLPRYFDLQTHQTGALTHSSMTAEMLGHLVRLPPLSQEEQPLIAKALQRLLPDVSPPSMQHLEEAQAITALPVPILRFSTVQVAGFRAHRQYSYTTGQKGHEYVFYDLAYLSFRYGDVEVSPFSDESFMQTATGQFVKIQRDYEEEKRWVKRAENYGFLPFNLSSLLHIISPLIGTHPLNLESEAKWQQILTDGTLSTMQAKGWELIIPHDFRHRVVEVESWELALNQEEAGWLGVDMGIIVAGTRLPLAPLLYALFRRDPRWLDKASLQQIDPQESVILQSDAGQAIRVLAERLKPLAETLVDLFNSDASHFAVPIHDAQRLFDLANTERWQFHGEASIIELAQTLRQAGSVQPIAPPHGLQIQLRHYQQEGLAWLQYLREHQLAGILADDMGLGKTAQTLAHILLEKEAGRLDRPCLIVLPTSLVFNWKNEAAKFAPDLRVLSLHGKARSERFAQIPEHDVCLTTYPLLWRDQELLQAHHYHLLILDEAQSVKNASSQAAQVVRTLETRHRLCLTGTPLENHLGELWAQFDFLLPGFLSDSKTFNKTWRTPIEKQGNQLRREILARRLRPFILRRQKDEVAAELPEKTIIIRSVELEAGQRDLYETVRSAMDQRVREEIATKGFARSQIVILDALLKLRQVCCDPRLLKTNASAKVKERAKLDLLMDMLPEMVAEGRKILLFSQFTQMLALIAQALDKQKLPYVMLTGETTDRETPVASFQAGDVPIFLISLKAGGVGLNLTAADTVIHYDPWWNPAVENQATDRAHRLGQTQKVFVYKLVVAGSIEEKILALQEKKAELAAGILSEDHEGTSKFSDADIAALFAPLDTTLGN